ncbi:related to KRI1-KRRI-Interacting protein 1 [Zygosaccharomyces bailii ISA1307]|nr:related to KRI1-KRRI-Interacting protein 1 [Zygosaccharomyces bailii ISA1307]
MPRKKSAAKKAREAEKSEKPKDIQHEPASDEVSEEEEHKSESSSEEEDEYGELITEDVEDGINKVLSALRNNDTTQLLNPEVKFFEDPERAAEKGNDEERQKPVYLKDYHRMNILSGNALEEEDEDEKTVDGKQSYVSQQNEEKSQLLKEINDAFDGDQENQSGNEEDDLLVKKEKQRPVPELKLPDPDKNGEEFLKAFDENQAWIPRKGDKIGDGEVDEDEIEFDNAVESFENAYNFRFEDPNSADIVSYARNQATLRRSDTSSRRRKRDETKLQKEAEKKEKERGIHKRKTEKVQKLTDVLEQLQKEYGREIDAKMVEKITNTLMNSDFKDDQWDKVISELFDAEFYAAEGKPSWDDDDEIMAEFNREKEQYSNSEGEIEKELEEETSGKKARKEKQKEKKSKRHLHEAVENAVEKNKLALIDEVEEERKPRARTREEQDVKFRYREVSPESFGLSARDIFAADDVQLNKYIGLKKFAPYRPKELRMKDKRKASKPKRLREWRKETFNNEEGPKAESLLEEEHGNSHKKRKIHKHR